MRPVFGLPGGGRRQHVNIADAGLVLQLLEAPERADGALDGDLVELAAEMQALAQAAENLFVEQNRRRPRLALIDDLAHGVRAEVDDGYRLAFLQPALGQLNRPALVSGKTAVQSFSEHHL